MAGFENAIPLLNRGLKLSLVKLCVILNAFTQPLLRNW